MQLEKKKLIIYLGGKPGAGKGTIAQLLSDRMHAQHIVASKLLFKLLIDQYGANSDEYKEVISGNRIAYYPGLDHLIINSVFESENRIILIDGYPRILDQLKTHIMLLNSNNILNDTIKILIRLDIDTDIAVKRIKSRLVCQDCGLIYSNLVNKIQQFNCSKCNTQLKSRDDDNEQIFRNRIITYQQTLDSMNKLREHVDHFYVIDVDKDIEDIFQIIKAIIDNHSK